MLRSPAARLFTVLLPLLLVAMAAAACSPPAPAQSGLVLYNGQHPETTAALVQAFEKRTGITVSVRSDDEDVLVDQLAAEGRRSPADVIYTENSPALEYLSRHHLLARLPRRLLTRLPPRYRSPAGDWVGVSARVSVLVYNSRQLAPSQLPRHVLGLASPRFAGKLAIAPDETDFQPVVTAVAEAYGNRRALAWLEGLRRNGAAHVYADNEAVTAAVNAGQAELGLIDQYYWYRLRSELGAGEMHSAIAFLAPGDPGYVLDVSGAGVLTSSRHKKAAESFLSFLLSRTGQEIIAHSDSFEYPLAAGVAAHAGLRPLSSLRPDPISLAALGDGQRAVYLMRRASLLP